MGSSRTTRSTRSAAPTSGTSWSSNATSRRDADDRARAELPLNQLILESANRVISFNRERKPKNLWSELGEGDPVHVIEVEDEHAEARFVAARDRPARRGGLSGSEIAVFYRTNAQSPRARGRARAPGRAYQVIGGPRFYERAEIKDLIAYLQVIDNPADAVSLDRIANRPRRGIGDASLARLADYAERTG